MATSGAETVLEAAPCDHCAHVRHCARTRATCKAYRSYLTGHSIWRRQQRIPDEQLYEMMLGPAIALDE